MIIAIRRNNTRFHLKRSGFLSLEIASLVQSLFEQSPWFKVRLAPSGDIDNFTGAQITSRRLGTNIFALKHPEAANLDAVILDQPLAHRIKEAVHYLGSQVIFATDLATNHESQFFFGDRRQALHLRGRTSRHSYFR